MNSLNAIRVILISLFLAMPGLIYAAIFDVDDINIHFPEKFDVFE